MLSSAFNEMAVNLCRIALIYILILSASAYCDVISAWSLLALFPL